MSTRKLQQVIDAQPTSDGAGVKLRRSIGSLPGLRLDPFLMLDEFSSDSADDYIAGFPSHPHRGFETVTYMLDGRMRHEDHMGNRGDLGPGDVQWMSAARGIIHSEMPQQSEGRMRGFQLWINLPAREKMKPASYRDIAAAQIPVVSLQGGGRVKLIAGSVALDGVETAGAIAGVSTEPVYLDVELPANAVFTQALPAAHNAFVYAYEGSLRIDDREVPRHAAGVLSAGDHFEAQAGPEGARFILLAGKPLREPVVQYGPFVMNTREEIEQALDDYRRGRLAA
ncbi:MAG TPA: pirin family protein [Solimonas sp.]|nr:pirin family protein [Solimonas sp.]